MIDLNSTSRGWRGRFTSSRTVRRSSAEYAPPNRTPRSAISSVLRVRPIHLTRSRYSNAEVAQCQSKKRPGLYSHDGAGLMALPPWNRNTATALISRGFGLSPAQHDPPQQAPDVGAGRTPSSEGRSGIAGARINSRRRFPITELGSQGERQPSGLILHAACQPALS